MSRAMLVSSLVTPLESLRAKALGVAWVVPLGGVRMGTAATGTILVRALVG